MASLNLRRLALRLISGYPRDNARTFVIIPAGYLVQLGYDLFVTTASCVMDLVVSYARKVNFYRIVIKFVYWFVYGQTKPNWPVQKNCNLCLPTLTATRWIATRRICGHVALSILRLQIERIKKKIRSASWSCKLSHKSKLWHSYFFCSISCHRNKIDKTAGS